MALAEAAVSQGSETSRRRLSDNGDLREHRAQRLYALCSGQLATDRDTMMQQLYSTGTTAVLDLAGVDSVLPGLMDVRHELDFQLRPLHSSQCSVSLAAGPIDPCSPSSGSSRSIQPGLRAASGERLAMQVPLNHA